MHSIRLPIESLSAMYFSSLLISEMLSSDPCLYVFFEEDVLKLLENIKFRDTKNHFRETLANDLKKINSSDKIFVFADKTRNIYETSLDTYNKLLHDNITKTYKHGSEDNISEINNELKYIADKLSIGNRLNA